MAAFSDIAIEQLLAAKRAGSLSVIDVRSPSEYREATIPGSSNIPFFDDAERAEIGTLYKQVSPEAAKARGLEIAAAKLPAFVKAFQEIEGDKAVFCWRGGMRSRTAATVLSLMDIAVSRLAGGYRSYREWVVGELDAGALPERAFIVNGKTGTGKTKILHRLAEQGVPVLDLEGLADHRGSVFGQIGRSPRNQKAFDSLLVEELQRLASAPYVVFEGESKRIGKVVLPDFILRKKEQGVQLYIDLPVEERVRHILEEYAPEQHQQECLETFQHIKRRIHTPVAKQIERDLESGDFPSAVHLLLEYHYDPLYSHSIAQYAGDQMIAVRARDIDEATDAVRDCLQSELARRFGNARA